MEGSDDSKLNGFACGSDAVHAQVNLTNPLILLTPSLYLCRSFQHDHAADETAFTVDHAHLAREADHCQPEIIDCHTCGDGAGGFGCVPIQGLAAPGP